MRRWPRLVMVLWVSCSGAMYAPVPVNDGYLNMY